MNIIVCLKQVPDTNEVKIDPVRGTLIREGVPSIINPDDKNALEEALRIKDENEDVKVTVLSMGPPQAEIALVEAIAMGADEAILLSDRAFAGSDTWATSTAIAAGIKAIGDYDMIFCGRQAIDGDTAQVGPQIAEHLNIPQITYVEELKLENGKVRAKRALEDGYFVVESEYPVLITAIKELNEPRYPSIRGIYEGFNGGKIRVLSAKDVNADINNIGLDGSPTQVNKSFTPPGRGEKCIGCGTCVDSCPFDAIDMIEDKAVINDKCTACGTCIEVCPVEAIMREEEEKEDNNIEEYSGVWVFAEQRAGELLNVAIELLGEGKKIANELNTELTAVLLGKNVDDIAETLVKYGADNVLYGDSELLNVYTTDGYTKVICDLINERKPEILLIGATNIGRDLGPRISSRIHTGLTADCTRLEVD